MHEEAAEAGGANPQSCLEQILSGHLEPGVGEGRSEENRGEEGEHLVIHRETFIHHTCVHHLASFPGFHK